MTWRRKAPIIRFRGFKKTNFRARLFLNVHNLGKTVMTSLDLKRWQNDTQTAVHVTTYFAEELVEIISLCAASLDYQHKLFGVPTPEWVAELQKIIPPPIEEKLQESVY